MTVPPSGKLSPVPKIWIIYNAYDRGDRAGHDKDWISEAAVEDEVEPVVHSLKLKGLTPIVYPLSSISDLLARWENDGPAGFDFQFGRRLPGRRP